MFNFISNAVYEYNRFSKILLKKNFEFVANEKIDPVLICFVFYTITIKSWLYFEEIKLQKDAFGAYGAGHLEIILALLVKEITFLVQVFIIEVEFFGLEWFILGYKICLKLTMFLTLNK